MTLNSIAEAEAALLPYVPLVAQLTGKDTVLDRIVPLMELLGNPQDKLKVVHIAGTSGKTSTAYFMSALLTAGGKKTGLTVSPHVDLITERVQINGLPISDELFCSELGVFLDLLERAAQKPSYFELLYSFSLWVFERQAVDFAVVETGMGGLYDATNVTKRPDKFCILTDIGYDHTHILGATLPEIAAQKVGIVHGHNRAITYQQPDEIMRVYYRWIADQKAELTVQAQPDPVLKPANLPDYQWRNWSLAYAAYGQLQIQNQLPDLTSQTILKTQFTQVPGRMDTRDIGGKKIIMDGAHNVQKITAFVESFQQLYPGVRPPVLLSLKHSKDYKTVVPIIASFTDKVIVTAFKTTQDLPVQSVDIKALATSLQKAGVQNVISVPDYSEAFKQLQDCQGQVAIVLGSFYLLSQLRRSL